MLQRRRRKSNPSSPSSPTFARRVIPGQDGSLNVSSPAEAFPATSIGLESPAIDVTVPSPTFDLPDFTRTPSAGEKSHAQTMRPGRSSDEYSQTRRTVNQQEQARPSTSTSNIPFSRPSGAHPGGTSAHSLGSSSPAPPAFEHFPNEGYYHDYRYRPDEHHFGSQRGFSGPLAAQERPSFDDGSSTISYQPKKSRLNLLPRGLFARRRASSGGKDEDNPLKINTSGVTPLPQGEVSIRGTRVVDFNAPRPRRMISHDFSSEENSPMTDGRPSLQYQRRSSEQARIASSPVPRHISSPKQPTYYRDPVEDNKPIPRPGQSTYVQSFAGATNVRGDLLAEKQPSHIRRRAIRLVSNETAESPAIVGNERAHIADDQPKRKISEHAPSPPSRPPPKAPPSPVLGLPPVTALPKHMTSTSSRFSFQLGTQDSRAQERLLEEKHKEKEASKGLEAIAADDEGEGDDMEDYDFEDDGLEERIPGVNADAEDDDFEPFSAADTRISMPLNASTAVATTEVAPTGLSHFHFTPDAAIVTPRGAQSGSQPTPRDAEGFRIGIAGSTDAPELLPPFDPTNGLGIGGLGAIEQAIPHVDTEFRRNETQSKDQSFDDIYFDDGEFDGPHDLDEGGFDEALLDQEDGPIRDIPAENARKLEAAQQAGRLYSAASWSKGGSWSETSQISREPQSATAVVEPRSSTIDDKNLASLTEGNLAAYHNALVTAANEAAANGRFKDRFSHSRSSDDWPQSQQEESQPGLISDESRLSHNLGGLGIGEDDGFPQDDNDFDDDDDLMIAEANAEALENDDDGFYGQEFGFYARAPAKNSADMINGGYFGPRGPNNIKRSHSAKANFPEPSLTPITERSGEWSTRNSISAGYVPTLPGSAISPIGPGLAQLRNLELDHLDEELSFDAFIRLKRGALGGSSNNVKSIPGSYTAGSPLTHVPNLALVTNLDPSHRMASSFHSIPDSAGIPEDDEEDDEAVGLPTLTQSSPSKRPLDTYPPTPQSSSAISPTIGTGGKISHSRTSSGAESVSYMRDPDGSDRWLLERRRTGDHGEIELVGREYLAGGRI